MLVLSRDVGEDIVIGEGVIRIRVLSIEGGQVRLGISAPKEVGIHRDEVHRRIHAGLEPTDPAATLAVRHAAPSTGTAGSRGRTG
ncbi:carbon storage regulator [Pseudomonas typographi]|uniref:Translational regulator CsrA n=1 Tax=Pseudomonas typographi TaxID=2715964 RepID=A0ABR7Z017_9PSED|nr:carbon storage regulator [Pseudomonas typographi]